MTSNYLIEKTDIKVQDETSNKNVLQQNTKMYTNLWADADLNFRLLKDVKLEDELPFFKDQVIKLTICPTRPQKKFSLYTADLFCKWENLVLKNFKGFF